MKFLKNTTTNTTNQTPIEVALQIDADGMTTASKLYDFLELDPTHFARWCKTNITDNKFAIEKEDYILAIDGENSKTGRPRQDYKLSASFAKKLCMIGNTERHEQAREYFLACEQGLKIATEKMRNAHQISAEELASAIASAISPLSDRINTLEHNLNKPRPTYTAFFTRMNPKYKLLEDCFDISRKELYHNLYIEFENRTGTNINELHEEYCMEHGLMTHECYPMDAIAANKQMKEKWIEMIDELLIELGLMDRNKPFTRKTLFDDFRKSNRQYTEKNTSEETLQRIIHTDI